MQNISNVIPQFQTIVGEQYVFTDAENKQKYGHDETENLYFEPDVIIKPRTAEEVSRVLKICNENLIHVTPRGAGTGLSGGALPHKGGVLLSMERFKTIKKIDEQNLQVIVEPGVITQELQDAVKEKGLFYPPDPASKGSCFIGGNISENSGGPKAVKYGVVKDYVLNLQMVLPNGEIIYTGSNVIKNATGYNLTQLVVGSEGTLGVVTEIVLRLIPHPKHDLLMLAPFNSLEKAGAAVSAIFAAGLTPSALELIDIDALNITQSILKSTAVPVSAQMEGHLIIEVDGNYPDILMQEMEQIASILETFGAGEILFADDSKQKEELWQLRRKAGETTKDAGYTIEEDTVVPRAELPALIKGVKLIGEKHNFKTVCFGHAGDGNLHIRLKKEGTKNSSDDAEIRKGIAEIFELVYKLGGTISGEHGIGLIQKEYMPIVFQPIHFQIMKGIKKVFDPNNILNVGKIFD